MLIHCFYFFFPFICPTLRSAAAFSGRLERLVRFTMKCGDTEGKTNQFHPGISVSVCIFLLPSNLRSFLFRTLNLHHALIIRTFFLREPRKNMPRIFFRHQAVLPWLQILLLSFTLQRVTRQHSIPTLFEAHNAALSRRFQRSAGAPC